SFSRTVPNSGTLFTVSPPCQGVMRRFHDSQVSILMCCGGFATMRFCQATGEIGTAARGCKITEPPHASGGDVPGRGGLRSQVSCVGVVNGIACSWKAHLSKVLALRCPGSRRTP